RELDLYLETHSSPLRQNAAWNDFLDIADGMARGRYEATPLTPAEHALFASMADALASETNRLVNIAPQPGAAFWITMSLALQANGRIMQLRDSNMPERASGVRDSSMANSLI